MTINNLWFIGVYFIKCANPEEFPLDSLTEGLVLNRNMNETNHRMFTGDNYNMEWLTYYDTVVLRFSSKKNGTLSSKDWCEKQRGFFNNKIQDLNIPADNSLGSSIVYWGLVDELEDKQYGTNKKPPTVTEFGNIWKQRESFDEREVEYILITPQNLEEKTRKNFLFAVHRGLIKIESHFHKASTEIMEYNSIREDLMESLRELDNEMVTLLKPVQDQEEKLDSVTQKYMSFVEMVSLATKLQNSLHLSIENYRDRLKVLSLKKKDNHIYDIHIKRFEKSLNQINYDLNYCQSTMSSVHTGLDLLRGANSIAIQRSGVAIQAAMVVVEVVFVSYYSLGIWHFIVNESTWEHISSFSKLIVGIGLASFLTLGSHSLYVSKNRKLCLGCVTGALIFVIYAYCVTCDINIVQVLTSFSK